MRAPWSDLQRSFGPSPPAQAGPAWANCPVLCPDTCLVSPVVGTSECPWATCLSALSPLQYKNPTTLSWGDVVLWKGDHKGKDYTLNCGYLRMFCIFISCSVQQKLMELIYTQNLKNAFLSIPEPDPLCFTTLFVVHFKGLISQVLQFVRSGHVGTLFWSCKTENQNASNLKI